MTMGARSKFVRTASELTLMARIKPGFVEGMPEPVTYATRLRILLSTLYSLRKMAEEQLADEYVGPLERLRTLHFVRYAIFDDDRRLLLAVSFDHSWETYMRALVDNAGALLDAIFCHCTDYAGYSCSRGHAGFTSWVKEHQIPVDFFFAAEPSLTVDDLRYLKAYQRLALDEQLPEKAARLHVGDYDPAATAERDPARALKLLGVLNRLQRYFPRAGALEHSDRAFFQGTVRALLWRSRALLDQLDQHVQHPGVVRSLLDWYRALHVPPPAPTLPAANPNREQIQGNILREYTGMTHACLVLMQCDDGAAMAKLLGRLAPRVTYDAGADAARTKLNVALTARGLKTLGLGELSRTAFPSELLDGMDARAGLLGDIAEHHPEHWRLPTINWPLDELGLPEHPGAPIALSSVDLVVLLQTLEEGSAGDHLLVRGHPLHDEVYGLRDHPGARILRVETMRRYPPPPAPPPAPPTAPPTTAVVEPFGFRDGVSLPSPRGAQPATGRDEVALGELVMGYADDRGEVQRYAPAGRYDADADLFKDASFLVLRKLEQDVPSFRAYAQASARALGLEGSAQQAEDAAAAMLMGRDKLGVPLMPHGPGLNDFDYEKDPDGQLAPLHAHVRRANPRLPPFTDGLRNATPRIARRSLPYGPAGERERGLVFMAYNARIAEQYEVIQSWLNGANSTGLSSSQNDLLTGVALENRGPHRVWVRGAPKDLPALATSPVTLRWGMYLFVPGKRAIERFATLSASESGGSSEREQGAFERAGREETARELVRRGGDLIAALGRLPREDARFEWKRILEGNEPSQRIAAAAAWAAIRARGGALSTPYGVLVGDAEETQRVLSDHTTFSVREYWARLESSVGALHLGMDPARCPIERSRPEDRSRDERYEASVHDGTYAAASRYNAAMYAISTPEAFALARGASNAVLDALIAELALLSSAAAPPTTPPPHERRELTVDLRALAFAVMEGLSKRWFDLPDGQREHFWDISLDTFRPNPERWVREAAQRSGEDIAAAYLARMGGDAEAARDRIAAVLGFTGPTTGAFMSVMGYWQANDQLPRIKQWWDARSAGDFAADDPARGPLYRWLIAAMQAAPVPDMLYRTALRDCTVGSERVAAGDRVIVSLASASADCPAREDLLFGGDYADKGALTHACPGRPLAIGVLLGMIAALLDRPEPRFVAPLVLAIGLPHAPAQPPPPSERSS